MSLSHKLAASELAASTPQQSEAEVLALEIQNKIARLRQISLDPVNIAYSLNISFEIRPFSDDQRLTICRAGWGASVVNYTREGLILDVFDQNSLLDRSPQCLHTMAIPCDELEMSEQELRLSQEELIKEESERNAICEVLNLLGYVIKAEHDVTDFHQDQQSWRLNGPTHDESGWYEDHQTAMEAAWVCVVENIHHTTDVTPAMWEGLSLDEKLDCMRDTYGFAVKESEHLTAAPKFHG